MSADLRVEVQGLTEYRRALKQVSDDLPKELRRANRDAANLVANEARGRASSVGGVAAHVGPSIRAVAQGTSAAVKWGGARFPMAGGAEFGAGRNVPRQTARGTVRGWNQFEAWTGSNSSSGRFVYPAIRARQADVVEAYAAAIDRITKQAFPD